MGFYNVLMNQGISAEDNRGLTSYCQILGVLRGPKTRVSDHRYHWVHQLAINAVMGYALGILYCNLDELQLFPFCIAG
jgi:hypothetical protein